MSLERIQDIPPEDLPLLWSLVGAQLAQPGMTLREAFLRVAMDFAVLRAELAGDGVQVRDIRSRGADLPPAWACFEHEGGLRIVDRRDG